MNASNDLFSEQGPEFAPVPDRLQLVAGKVVATTNKPSAAQKRFNTLMARVDAEQILAAALRHTLDTHLPPHRQALHDMEVQYQALIRSMVLLLDARIQAPAKAKGLTANQKQQATRMLLSLAEGLPQPYDAEIEAVWARYTGADDDGADANQQAKQEAQALLASYLGEDFAQGREFDSPEEVLRAALEFEQQKLHEKAQKQEAKRAARKAQKGPSAREQAAAQKELDAQNALRTVFRQLASALHPDREPDAAARQRKTELMSEVNAAYERKDLTALLRIQLQEELVDASKAAVLSEAKLKAMCDLLTEQLRTLEQDNLQMRFSMEHEFGYPAVRWFRAEEFLETLRREQENLQADLDEMQADLQRVQDDKELKAWLKAQVRVSKSRIAPDDVGMDLDEVLHAMMRQR